MTSPLRVRVLVADDEPLARRRLRALLAGVAWIDSVSEAASGDEAIRRIDDERPDLVLLDVQMPGATGLEVLERCRHRPHVVFTTAYDRHAVAAFELQALDYLLKPFGEERFRRSLERVREALGRDRRDRAPGGGADLDERLRGVGEGPLRRIFVRRGSRIYTVPVDQVERFEAAGDYVRAFTADDDHLISVRLADLEERLDAVRFLRIHRSHIVNLDHVEEFRPHTGSRYLVRLRSGASVVASRRRSRDIRRRAR